MVEFAGTRDCRRSRSKPNPRLADVEGGRIVRGSGGQTNRHLYRQCRQCRNEECSGVFKGRDSSILFHLRCRNVLKYGLTSVQDMWVDEEDFSAYRELLESNGLPDSRLCRDRRRWGLVAAIFVDGAAYRFPSPSLDGARDQNVRRRRSRIPWRCAHRTVQ